MRNRRFICAAKEANRSSLLIPPVAESRVTVLNLMVDALLDFHAIAFLTSIPLLTTTLVSTCPILFNVHPFFLLPVPGFSISP